ncbi:GNAT family N-acetyltransferase [Amycolatopsis sp. NPDC059021]|uniref:GNAT family N-acetyltransferase n=1 Tax=Amycolatopsis sp. NPDC059021 TaxID=3346704 RepID=UPI00366B3C78
MTSASPLDNPTWASLTGPHAGFAQRHGQALRYPADVVPFYAVPGEPGERIWHDLAGLAGPGQVAHVAFPDGELIPPDGWAVVNHIHGVQLVDAGLTPAEDPEAIRLGPADVPEMLDLVERTQPGPFLPRTIELGTYLGIRHHGALVAMAGERLRPPGWTEISAVCTDPAHRGKGLATRLVLAVAAGIRARGETPMLHTTAANTTAIRLYESLGFAVRRKAEVLAVRVPPSV